MKMNYCNIITIQLYDLWRYQSISPIPLPQNVRTDYTYLRKYQYFLDCHFCYILDHTFWSLIQISILINFRNLFTYRRTLMRKFYKVRTLAIFFASSFDSLNCRPPTDVKDRASMLVIIFSTCTQQISSQFVRQYDLSTGYHHMCKVQNERF